MNLKGLVKRDKDEVKSAKLILEEAETAGPHSLYAAKPIPLHVEDGFMAIAFALPHILGQWGGCICEVALDSAYESIPTTPFT
jgi:hypothetical protein